MSQTTTIEIKTKRQFSGNATTLEVLQRAQALVCRSQKTASRCIHSAFYEMSASKPVREEVSRLMTAVHGGTLTSLVGYEKESSTSRDDLVAFVDKMIVLHKSGPVTGVVVSDDDEAFWQSFDNDNELSVLYRAQLEYQRLIELLQAEKQRCAHRVTQLFANE
jgi:hypothetical protein